MTIPIIVDQVFNSESIAASGSATYDIKLSRGNAEGFFSVHIVMTGDGTMTFDYLESNNNLDFVDPEDDITTGFLKTSGPASNGKDLFPFEPNLCRWLRLRATETGGNYGIVVSAWVAIQ